MAEEIRKGGCELMNGLSDYELDGFVMEGVDEGGMRKGREIEWGMMGGGVKGGDMMGE